MSSSNFLQSFMMTTTEAKAVIDVSRMVGMFTFQLSRFVPTEKTVIVITLII